MVVYNTRNGGEYSESVRAGRGPTPADGALDMLAVAGRKWRSVAACFQNVRCVCSTPWWSSSQTRPKASSAFTTVCACPRLTSTRDAGTTERFGRFRLQVDELVLVNADYCHPARIAAVISQQADVCALPLLDTRGKPFSLLKQLARLRDTGKMAYGVARASSESPSASVRFARAAKRLHKPGAS